MRPLRLLPALAAALLLAAPSTSQPFFFSKQTLELPTNDIVYEPGSGLLYASVPSAGSTFGNEIVAIDPATATIVDSVLVGSEPGPLALSDDGSVLWVGLDGARAIRRVELPSLTPGLHFPVGTGTFGAMLAEDIEVQPGTRDVIAVSRRNVCCSPRHEGVAVYDNGVPRAATTASHTGANRIEFSDSPDVLYGYNNETTEFGFRRIAVSSAGAVQSSVAAGLISGFGVDILFDAGRLYATSGVVLDPAVPTRLGQYAAGGPVRPAAERGLVFFLERPFGDAARLGVFDKDRFVRLATFALGFTTDIEPYGRMVRIGEDGLAVRMGSYAGPAADRIVLMTVSDQPPPDADSDGVADAVDNCPEHPNPAQEDADADRFGDACDRFPDDADNLGACVDDLDVLEAHIASLESALADALGRLDSDRDGVPDAADACSGSRRNGTVDASGCQPWQRRPSSD